MKRNQVFLALTMLTVVALGITACGTSTSTTASVNTGTTPTTAPVNQTPPTGGAFSDNRTTPTIDWATAASKLGVSEEALRQAFTGTGQGMPDMAQIATTLGVTEDALRQALGFTQGGPGGGQPPTGTPPSGTPPTGLPVPPTTSGKSGSTTE